MYRSSETEPLINKGQKNKNGFLSWILKIIIFILLLLLIIYVVLDFYKDKTESEPDISSKIVYPAHISSSVTFNDDFFKKCAPKHVTCDPNAKYRSINGSCNNLLRPTWGSSVTPMIRLLNPIYADGFRTLPVQKDGSKLPSSRLVNVEIFMARETYIVDVNNVLLLPFGQMLSHDLSRVDSDVPHKENGEIVNCCTDEVAAKIYPQCELNIIAEPDDPVNGKLNITCIGTYRSMTSANYSCPLYPTTFVNTNTHYLDASEIYGSNETVASRLRTFEGGNLNFSIGENGEMFCPYKSRKKNEPYELRAFTFLYDTGSPEDGNQNLALTSLQILFLRFHNFLVFKLSNINPKWSDETLYQEARRIVIALIQHVTYNDFLPIVIGRDFQELYGINKDNIYDPTINPSFTLAMSSAAMRVLHAIIPVEFKLMGNDYKVKSSINVTDWMSDPVLLPEGENFDQLLKGFLETPGRLSQPSFNFYASNFVFHNPPKKNYIGLDLFAIDIARARDGGLPPYNQFRQLCGIPLAKNFEDLVDLIPIKDINKLKKLYYSVDDIDLLVGLLLEKHSDGAIVGPTTRCLFADAFYRMKAADRFFYDRMGQPGSFTPNQLKIIKTLTLGHVICAASNVNDVQVDMFKYVDHNSFPFEKLKCNSGLLDLNLDDWKDSEEEL